MWLSTSLPNRILLFFFIITTTTVINADRVLLLLDKHNIKETHSLFIKSLEDRGHEISVKLFEDSSVNLIKHGEFFFDHLIIFANSGAEFRGSLKLAEIVKFVDGGGNVLLATAPNPSTAIKKLIAEFGFGIDGGKAEVIDHHNYDTVLDKGLHTTLVIPTMQMIKSNLITGDRTKLGPILYHGIALTAENSNPLRLVVMTGSTSAYSFDPALPVNEYPAAIGKSTILIGALQARNNARVLISGSLDLFSDEYFKATVNKYDPGSGQSASKSGNEEFAASLSKWILKEVGVLRINAVTHHIIGQKEPPHEYTIMEDVKYEIAIDELKERKWVPFKATDVQLEFVRIDPFIRKTLANKNGKFSAQFKIPDVYGVFKFLVDYNRVGYTYLHDVQQVSVRPLKHTQYERFSRCAYPYYASALSMMFGVFIFSIVFLYHKEQPISSIQGKSLPSGKDK